MSPDQLEVLLERYLDEGELSNAEQVELLEALESQSWAQEQFVARMTLAAELHERLSVDHSPDRSEVQSLGSQRPIKQAKSKQWWWAVPAVVATLLLAVFVFNSGQREYVALVAAEEVGTLDTQALQEGGKIRLSRGLLEMDLNGDARVVVEGPATFRVVSASHLQLESGRCFAEMEEGKSGLRIETPLGDVLDLGTKFAVDMLPSQLLKVHVFDGMVEINDRKETRQLVTGEAISVASSGLTEELAANSNLFIPRVPRDTIVQTPYLHWALDASDSQDGEQASILPVSGRDLQVELGQAQHMGADNEPVPPNQIDGPVGRAIEFRNDSWIRTQHPGISGDQDRTVACWIRLPAGSLHSAPVIAWGYRKRKRGKAGESRAGKSWMMSVVGFRKKRPELGGVLSVKLGTEEVLGTTDLRDGRWHHIAAVTMAVEHGAAVLLYVDGKLEHSQHNLVDEINTASGNEIARTVQIGRNLFTKKLLLDGALDEIYLFGGALSGDEIRHLMRLENPE